MPNAPSSARPWITSAGMRRSRSIEAESMRSRANARKDSRKAATVSRSEASISGYGKTVSSGIAPAEEGLHDRDEARLGRRSAHGPFAHAVISRAEGGASG